MAPGFGSLPIELIHQVLHVLDGPTFVATAVLSKHCHQACLVHPHALVSQVRAAIWRDAATTRLDERCTHQSALHILQANMVRLSGEWPQGSMLQLVKTVRCMIARYYSTAALVATSPMDFTVAASHALVYGEVAGRLGLTAAQALGCSLQVDHFESRYMDSLVLMQDALDWGESMHDQGLPESEDSAAYVAADLLEPIDPPHRHYAATYVLRGFVHGWRARRLLSGHGGSI